MTSPLDTLTSNDVKQLLHEKYILILGDSVIRSLYKDLVKFSNIDEFLNEGELRYKGEKRFFGDRLIRGGVRKGSTCDIDYEEVREHSSGGLIRIRYYFLRRCYSSYMTDVIFNDIANQTIKPDIIIMNSCLWDISQYGISSMQSYRQNIDLTMGSFRQMLPNTLFLWLSALPVSNSSSGDVVVANAEYVRLILPGLIRDGNYHCSQMCNIHNVLYVDVHTIFSNMLHLRQADGIHWNTIAYRIINEIILNHIKAYFDGVTNFKCHRLRAELGNKIKIYQQRMNDRSSHTNINYDGQHVSHVENQIAKRENTPNKTNEVISTRLKRKRTNDDDDENLGKVVRKSIVVRNHTITITIDNSINQMPIKQEKSPNYETSKIDREFSNTTDDNEYKDLSNSHYCSFDFEQSEIINNLQSLNHIKNEQITMNNDPIDIKPLANIFTSVPIATSHYAKTTADEPEYIIVSSDDDEDGSTFSVVPTASTTNILPIYLLNHH